MIAILPGLHKYRPIQGSTVARAMINAAFNKENGIYKYTLDEVFKLAGE